jgi:dTDP-4-dehydrorhamnose reductase
MKKTLLIGADGMLGTDLSKTLPGDFQCIKSYLDGLDITDGEATLRAIRATNPHVVINAAGFTAVDLCEKEKEEAFAVNSEGAQHVAAACKEVGAKCVYISSDYVFDGKKGKPYTEEDPTNPLSTYGRSKLQGENRVRESCPDSLIVRSSWLFGVHGSNFVKTVLKLSEERGELEMVDDQRGSPTYTEDLSKAIASLVLEDSRGIFHAANRGACTWFEFAQKILELAGSSLKLIPVSTARSGRPAARPPNSVLNCEKLEKATGMMMPRWEDALARFLGATR